MQSKEVFEISGQTSRDWNPVASTRVGKMSTNSTSLLDLVMINFDKEDFLAGKGGIRNHKKERNSQFA